MFSILSNYFFSHRLDRAQGGSRRFYLILALVANFGVLFYYKYFNFFALSLAGATGLSVPLIANAHLPVGISFFTFQAVTYIWDIYNRKVEKPIDSISNLVLYIVLFPKLIAGPIVQYNEIHAQIFSKRRMTIERVRLGLSQFLTGLAKKVLIANNIAILADKVYESPDIADLPPLVVLIGVLAYTLQIYFDFSGYSQMAIGIGNLLGFDLPQNFDYPYISRSIKEFWRRWHITLGRWFRDYVYIPLGGNRGGVRATYRNLLIVFLLTGLWHGASWNFVLWGGLNGLLIVAESSFLRPLLRSRIFGHAYLLTATIGLWVLFRANTFEDALIVYRQLLRVPEILTALPRIPLYMTNEQILFFLLGVLLSTPLLPALRSWLARRYPRLGLRLRSPLSVSRQLLLASLFVLTLAYIIKDTYNPFIYFRF